MALVRFDSVSLDFGAHKLLRETEFSIEPGERVCLIGRNGAGKTSMLKLITGQVEPDAGLVIRQSDLCIGQLDQALPPEMDLSVAEFVATGLADMESLCAEYQRRSQLNLDASGLRDLEALHSHIETHGGWNLGQRVASVCSEMALPTERLLKELSGGWCRRVALARALVSSPDLLLLDEPTNHLDFAAIDWLEQRIMTFPGAVLFITHDRTFLQGLASRIVEIDRGGLVSWPGDYAGYLRARQKALDSEERDNRVFDRKLAKEEAWIREGIQARRTRNEGRVRALAGMRQQRAERVRPDDKPRIHIEQAESSGRRVLRVRNVSFGYAEEKLVKQFSLNITRGDRIGLVGNNGVGKSTLLSLLMGDLLPDSGTIKRGVNVEVGYFGQYRRELDLDKTVAEAVGDGQDYVSLDGRPRHVVGYLRGFLFSAKRALTPVRALSGGERNRVLLARLFVQPANLLVLDEPTNDLDVETLEVLEAQLARYSGTLIVVSHDRAFLDNVVSSVLVFEEQGRIRYHLGGYSDWARRGQALATVDDPQQVNKRAKSSSQGSIPVRSTAKKLTYKLQHELEGLPDHIEELENKVSELQSRIAIQGFYEQPFTDTQPVLDELEQQSAALDQALARWTELEDIRAALEAAS